MIHQELLTEKELDCIEARCAAATAGPWLSFVVGRDTEAGLNYIELAFSRAIEVVGANVADQDFIAAAREDVPRLIAEVRRLKRYSIGETVSAQQDARAAIRHLATA